MSLRREIWSLSVSRVQGRFDALEQPLAMGRERTPEEEQDLSLIHI